MPDELEQQRRKRARRTKPFEQAVQRWMLKRAREEAARQVKALRQKGDKWTVAKTREPVAKAVNDVDQDLLQIFMRFGVAQAKDALTRVSATSGLERVVEPSNLQRELATKQFKLKWFTEFNGWATKHVKKISADTRDMVKQSIMRILVEASGETPLPSPGEMARRIRTQFHGEDAKGRIYAWSPERAALIVRTELNMADNTAARKGYELVDKLLEGTNWVLQKRWLAKTDGRSGDRHHEKMHRVTLPMDEDFVLPDGTRMKYPGDPSAPVHQLVNCRCGHRVLMVKRVPKDTPARTRGL